MMLDTLIRAIKSKSTSKNQHLIHSKMAESMMDELQIDNIILLKK